MGEENMVGLSDILRDIEVPTLQFGPKLKITYK
jgi:hypothetical protein